MSNAGTPPSTGFRERIETLCNDMIDKGILFSEAMERFERCFIAEIVKRNKGNVTKAAAVLGIHRNTLSSRMNNGKLKRRR
jgi:transcriptional regulator with PAS, ATPase and Fis domain